MRAGASLPAAWCVSLAAILCIGIVGTSPAHAQQIPKANAAARQAVAKPGDAPVKGVPPQKSPEPATAPGSGAASGSGGASVAGSPNGAASGNELVGANIPSAERPDPRWMLLAFIVLPAALLLVLHLVDSIKAYSFSATTRDKALDVLEGKLSAAQVLELVKLTPTGIAGTTRSIFTYGLLVVLGGAVFHLLTFSSAPHAAEYADKLLTVLAGALSSVIGFYFGSKATSEGVSSGALQRTDPPAKPVASITRINPPSAQVGQEVRIEGTGFGDAPGNVDFAGSAAPGTLEWTATVIRVEVPSVKHKGRTTVTVNPAQAGKIVGNNVPFDIVE